MRGRHQYLESVAAEAHDIEIGSGLFGLANFLQAPRNYSALDCLGTDHIVADFLRLNNTATGA
jgi:hypothetical protein